MISPRLASLAVLSLALTALPRLRADATVHWLEGDAPPPRAVGVSFGVPWARGTVAKTQAFELKAADGRTLPVQTWALAYWPDGSIKWSGVATVAGAQGPFHLTPAAAAAIPAAPRLPRGDLAYGSGPGASGAVPSGPALVVKRFETGWEIDTGKLQARIPEEGDALIDALVVDGREVARDGRLVCILQDGPDGGPADTPAREKFVSKLEKVTVEQSGPVRAVVKFEGKHRGLRNNREWLPFVVRMYFYAGESTVRVVHTIVF